MNNYYWIIIIVFLYPLIALIFNLYCYLRLKIKKFKFNENWLSYNEASLFCDDKIFKGLTESIKQESNLFISMFFWHFMGDTDISDEYEYNYSNILAEYLNEKNVIGEIYCDPINLEYEMNEENFTRPGVIKRLWKMKWNFPVNCNAIPNNIIMWIVHTPFLQKILEFFSLYKILKYYQALKITSNHQKIVIIDSAKAWFGSRNFNAKNWYNYDHFLFFSGDIAVEIHREAVNTIFFLNYRDKKKYNNLYNNLSGKEVSFKKFNNEEKKIIKLLKSNEVKSCILELINRSDQIDILISLFSDISIIKALNKFVERGGRLRIIMDPNNYIFNVKLPLMPNILPILKIHKDADLRISKTNYQLHTKAAMFYINENEKYIFEGTGNWTKGALDRYSYSDLGLCIYNDSILIKEWENNFQYHFSHSISRDDLILKSPKLKYISTRILLLIGLNPW